MRSGWMGLPEAYETHLLSRIAQEEAQRSALTTEVNALRAEIELAVSAATVAPVPLTRHAACDLCGYWDADQHRVAGHICRRLRKRAPTGCSVNGSEGSGRPGPPWVVVVCCGLVGSFPPAAGLFLRYHPLPSPLPPLPDPSGGVGNAGLAAVFGPGPLGTPTAHRLEGKSFEIGEFLFIEISEVDNIGKPQELSSLVPLSILRGRGARLHPLQECADPEAGC